MKKFLAISILLVILTIPFTLPKNTTATGSWEIVITDRTGQQNSLTYEQLTTMPSTTEEAALSCYGSPVTDGLWTGVKISDILLSVNADTSAGSIEFTAQDGYQITIPMETALQSDVILAYSKDSLPLQETYRLVVPWANGNVWIALVTSIVVSDAGAPNLPEKSPGLFDITQLFSENANQATRSSDPTSMPTIKPTTPNPTPIETATPTSTLLPTNTNAPANTLLHHNLPLHLTYFI